MAYDKIIPFLKKLKSNNNKEWFEKNRSLYEAAQAQTQELAAELIKKVSAFDPGVKDLDAKKCLFRIYRDVRFSKDKTPYKINMGVNMTEGGKKSPKAGYYLHLEPGNCFIGGGIWQPEPDVLKKIRQEIDYNGAALEKILKSAAFKAYFDGLYEEDKLSRPPKEYDEKHKYIELLKNRHFIVLHAFKEKELESTSFPTFAAKIYKAHYPFNSFLNQIFA